MKKVAYCLFSDGLGGAENIVLQTLRHLKNNDNFYLIVNNEIAYHFKDVIPVDRLLNIGDIYLHKKYKFVRYLLNNRFYNLRKLSIDIQLKSISTFITNNRIEILHTHLDYALYTGLKIKVKFLPNLKIIFTVHSAFGFLDDKSLKPQLPFKYIDFNKIDLYIFVSRYVYELYKSKVAIKEYHIIYNGIGLDYNPQFKHSFLQGEVFNILYMGGDKVVKGYDIMVESIECLINRYGHKNIKVQVLGPLCENSTLVRLIEQKHLANYFELVGYTPSAQLAHFYSTNHVLFMPSRTEAMPLAGIEAVFYNLPIIASKVGGIPELIQDGSNGFCSNALPENFAGQLKNLAENYLNISTATVAKNVELHKQFKLQTMCDCLLSIYR